MLWRVNQNMRDTASGIIATCTHLEMIKWSALHGSPSTGGRGTLRAVFCSAKNASQTASRTDRAPRERFELLGEDNNHAEALSRQGRLELSTAAFHWRDTVRVFPNACVLELPPIRPGKMSGEPCLSIPQPYERKTRRRFPMEVHHMCCSTSSLTASKCFMMPIRS